MRKPWQGEFPVDRGPLDEAAQAILILNMNAGRCTCDKCGVCASRRYFQNDSRPRVDYRLPDGRIVPIIFDHDDDHPPTITYSLTDGSVVLAERVA